MKAKTYTVLLPLILGIMGSGCEGLQQMLDVKKPTASLKGFRFGDITLKSATLLFDVEVTNPYPVALPLLDMNYAIASGANPLLSGKADIQSTIPAGDKKVISLPATVGYIDLAKAFMGIKPGSKIPYKADLGLSVDTPGLGVLTLPLKKTGELAVPEIPKVDELDWKKILLDKTG